MKLDFNFDAKTRLKNWWLQIKNNLTLIEDEINKIEEKGVITDYLADGAVTKEKIDEAFKKEIEDNNLAEETARIKADEELSKRLDEETEARTIEDSDHKNTYASIEQDGHVKLYSKSVSGVNTNRSGLMMANNKEVLVNCASTGCLSISGAGQLQIANGAITKAKLSADLQNEIDEKNGNLTIYSTTPRQVGVWVDGKPVWRMAFKKSFDEITRIWTDEALLVTDVLADFCKPGRMDYIFVINSNAMMYDEAEDVYDDVLLVYRHFNLGTGWNLKDTGIETATIQQIYEGIYGWIEFVSDADNLNL